MSTGTWIAYTMMESVRTMSGPPLMPSRKRLGHEAGGKLNPCQSREPSHSWANHETHQAIHDGPRCAERYVQEPRGQNRFAAMAATRLKRMTATIGRPA